MGIKDLLRPGDLWREDRLGASVLVQILILDTCVSWPSHLVSLSPQFPIYNIGIKYPIVPHRFVGLSDIYRYSS